MPVDHILTTDDKFKWILDANHGPLNTAQPCAVCC